MRSILFVDDEKAILRSLKRLFFHSGWGLYLAEDGSEALRILSENHIDMVISDMRMPNMDGYKLLKEIRRLYPHTIRLILSGFSDEQEIYRAVLDGSAKNYLLKPWEPDKLMDFIYSTFELYDKLCDGKYLSYIENMRFLPTLHCVVEEINKMLEEDADISGIAEIIEMDPGLSARILQLVNSSSYDKRIGSVRHALFCLGHHILKNIVNDEEHTYHVDLETEAGLLYKLISKHAVVTNRLMKATYKTYLGKEMPEIAVTASALHNVGVFLVGENQAPHNEIGGYLLRWWGIPEEAVECAFFHHQPFSASIENYELLCVTHLGNYYASSYLEHKAGELDLRVLDFLHIDKTHYENFVIDTLLEFDFYQCFWN